MIRVWNEEIDQIINEGGLLSEGRAEYRGGSHRAGKIQMFKPTPDPQ
jgi:hypothetical protein